MDFFGLRCIPRFFKTVKSYGGIKACAYKMWRMDGLKPGVCVGEDTLGNKYFENNNYFFGRNRWVSYFITFLKEFSL